MGTRATPNSRNSNLYSLLIGIDYYFSNMLPDGSYYPNLSGCVRDVNHMYDFLKLKVGIPTENILTLTSSKNNNSDRPKEPHDNWPTYENMVKSFKRITKIAKPGDQVYIHYSGHGGRVKTLLPKIKGENGLDETIVPLDIGDPANRHLRDIEIAKLLQNMIDRRLIVAIVLDSCHSGGATRGRGGAAVRGIDAIDTTLRSENSLVASRKELANTWESMISKQRRTITTIRNIDSVDSGWLPEPKGYVLLAACRPSESAYEYAFEGTERNGALTYWLLKSLEQLGKGLTYKLIHDRIVAKIHSQFPLQTPMLEGDGDLEIFGSKHVRPVYATNIMQVDMDRKRVMLNVGQVHGIRKGTRFAIYPWGFTDFNKVEKRIAIVEIEDRGSTNSWAKIISNLTGGSINVTNIDKGFQAVLIDPVDVRLKRTVRLIYQNGIYTSTTPPNEKGNSTETEHLNKLKNIILLEGKGFLELADENTERADYQIAISNNGEYEVWDPAGNAISNLNPPLKIDDLNSASRLIQRLVHLTKFTNVQQIDNLDAVSELSRKVIVELFAISQDFDPSDGPPNLESIESIGNTKMVSMGQKLALRIKNTLPEESGQVLNVTVLDLQPDWAITQIYPSTAGANFIPIDAGKEELFLMQADLPTSFNQGIDIIKVFITIDSTNFRWLELPPIDQPLMQRESRRSIFPTTALEQLMAAITKDKAITRDLNPSASPSKEWTTAQIEVQIMR